MRLEFPHPDELAPDELKAVCDNTAFRALVAYCQGKRQWWPLGDDDRFDRDELGVDPEDDYDEED